jgi:surface polysaccharide O-acyltransferase-like enzyme
VNGQKNLIVNIFFFFSYLIIYLFIILIGKAGHLHTSSTAATIMIDGDGNIVTTPRNSRLRVYLPIECPPGVQKYFPDPYDCSAYHYCNGKF